MNVNYNGLTFKEQDWTYPACGKDLSSPLISRIIILLCKNMLFFDDQILF